MLKPSRGHAADRAQGASELYDAAGLPPDLFQVVTGRGATGAALIDAGIDYCVFTGSVATGKKVAAACGERLIPCTLELGGKAPAIVCADADLDRAAQAIMWGGFANSGQVCASVERVYAHRVGPRRAGRANRRARAASCARATRRGRSDVDVGAMTWDRQVENVEKLVDAAVAPGAQASRPAASAAPGPGLFFEPTVLTDCTPGHGRHAQGDLRPGDPDHEGRDEDEAVRLANDSHLGLLAYVFTRDRERGKRLAERIEAGTVMVNDVLNTYACPETPWGGVKQSGIGRTHSVDRPARPVRDAPRQLRPRRARPRGLVVPVQGGHVQRAAPRRAPAVRQAALAALARNRAPARARRRHEQIGSPSSAASSSSVNSAPRSS